MNELEILKKVVEELIAITPKSLSYMNDDIKISYARQIFIGLNESNLNNIESINKGIKESRKNLSEDIPSVGTFISDCSPETSWADALSKVI